MNKKLWWPISFAWNFKLRNRIPGKSLATLCGCMRWFDWHVVRETWGCVQTFHIGPIKIILGSRR